jgi:hypothetical protein
MSREALIELQNAIHFTHQHKAIEALERSGEIIEPGQALRNPVL